uniref:BURP domain-containing protein n=1 Tax=Salix viminalis TaxID=40686 RepID=A0A6N2KY80_SALVM
MTTLGALLCTILFFMSAAQASKPVALPHRGLKPLAAAAVQSLALYLPSGNSNRDQDFEETVKTPSQQISFEHLPSCLRIVALKLFAARPSLSRSDSDATLKGISPEMQVQSTLNFPILWEFPQLVDLTRGQELVDELPFREQLEYKCVRLFISGGIGPTRLLCVRESTDKLRKFPKDAGIVPISLLYDKINIVRDVVRFPMEAGIVPVRLLFDNAKLVRDLMFPMEAGIVPFRLLFDNNKLVRDLRFPMEAGIMFKHSNFTRYETREFVAVKVKIIKVA